ncbi:MAG: T9SS type A sorting domain-containing protein [Luteibaculaceae bacterium]
MKKLKIFLLSCLITITQNSIAQEISVEVESGELLLPLIQNPLQKSKTNRSIYHVLRDDTPLELPFVEDFSLNRFPNGNLPVESQYWIDNHAFRNFTYPINPITYWVATLDGLNAEGMPYNLNNPTAFGIADFLTSRKINLTGSANDSIYFSFFFQGKGIGNVPEPMDSLVLEFFSPLNNAWFKQWSTPGRAMDQFELVMIPIIADMFLHPEFQFRFKNYATLSGSFDHWHIDYILLDKNRSFNDTLPRDVAFKSGIKSLLRPYTSVPWSHYKINDSFFMVDTVSPVITNTDDALKNVVNAGMQIIRERDGNVDWNIPFISNTFNFDPLSTFKLDFPIYNNQSSFVTFNTMVPDTFINYVVKHYATNATPPERLTTNDTITHIQTFADYYAYDDGTAEAAYCINTNGSVSIRYNTLVPDTLIGAYIHFAPARFDRRDFGFFLTVWNSILPIEEVTYRNFDFSFPRYVADVDSLSGLNQFHFYAFDGPIPVDGEFFIGYTKPEPEPLNFGFDLNNNNNFNTFVSFGFEWTQAILQGAIMLRPAFKSDFNVLNVASLEKKSVVNKLFPNPNKGLLQIVLAEPNAPHQVRVYSQLGKLVKEVNGDIGSAINLQNLANGLYIVEVTNLWNKQIAREKIIIAK